jgi:hypothetical protein
MDFDLSVLHYRKFRYSSEVSALACSPDISLANSAKERKYLETGAQLFDEATLQVCGLMRMRSFVIVMEISAMVYLQIDTWLTSIGTSYLREGKEKREMLDRPLSGAWLKILPIDTEEVLR